MKTGFAHFVKILILGISHSSIKLIEALFVTCSEVKSMSGIEYTTCPS